MSATGNYFAIEQPLVERVKAVLPDVQYVITAETSETAKEWRKAPKAAHVIYVGDEVGQGPAMQGGGGVQLTSQLWMVVLQVKHAGTVQSGDGARRIAGPLIWNLLQGLTGYQLLPAWSPLRRAPGPKAGYQDGFGFYPFVFRTNNLIRGKV